MAVAVPVLPAANGARGRHCPPLAVGVPHVIVLDVDVADAVTQARPVCARGRRPALTKAGTPCKLCARKDRGEYCARHS